MSLVDKFYKFGRDVERGAEKEVKYFERWVIARRKFFIKLAWVAGLIAILLIFSHFYLRIRGVGV
jgi:hypothetical protein